jgi:N6-adenosine-specific RNA methylase IME4
VEVAKSSLTRLRSDGAPLRHHLRRPAWPERGACKIKRGADRHYPLMKVADIVIMSELVQDPAKPDSHLYLWTTNTYLPHALAVMKAWGFEYRAGVT